MKIILDITDNKVPFIMELLQNFNFVKAEALSPEKDEIIQSLKSATKEIKSIKKGKTKAIPLKDFLDEL